MGNTSKTASTATPTQSSAEAFARREATTGQHWIENGPSWPLKRDLVLYEDRQLLREIGRIRWDQPGAKARKRVQMGKVTYDLTFPKLDRGGHPV